MDPIHPFQIRSPFHTGPPFQAFDTGVPHHDLFVAGTEPAAPPPTVEPAAVRPAPKWRTQLLGLGATVLVAFCMWPGPAVAAENTTARSLLSLIPDTMLFPPARHLPDMRKVLPDLKAVHSGDSARLPHLRAEAGKLVPKYERRVADARAALDAYCEKNKARLDELARGSNWEKHHDVARGRDRLRGELYFHEDMLRWFQGIQNAPDDMTTHNKDLQYASRTLTELFQHDAELDRLEPAIRRRDVQSPDWPQIQSRWERVKTLRQYILKSDSMERTFSDLRKADLTELERRQAGLLEATWSLYERENDFSHRLVVIRMAAERKLK